MMKLMIRPFVYLALALALLGVFVAGGEALARPLAEPTNQTVPTRTPRPTPVTPTAVPPTAVPPTAAPGQTPDTPPTAAPGQTPAPAPTAAPGQTPVAPSAPAGSLALTKTTGQLAIWPGMTATFTVTLRNSGAASVRQVVIEDTLPAGLEPGAVLAGAGAAWNGRVLRATAPVLAPGGVLRVVYTARVGATLAPDAVLVNRAVATAADGQQASASVALGQPPLELPTTGGDLGAVSRLR